MKTYKNKSFSLRKTLVLFKTLKRKNLVFIQPKYILTFQTIGTIVSVKNSKVKGISLPVWYIGCLQQQLDQVLHQEYRRNPGPLSIAASLFWDRGLGWVTTQLVRMWFRVAERMGYGFSPSVYQKYYLPGREASVMWLPQPLSWSFPLLNGYRKKKSICLRLSLT